MEFSLIIGYHIYTLHLPPPPFLCPWGVSYTHVVLQVDTLLPLVPCSHSQVFPPILVAMPPWGHLSPLRVKPNCSTSRLNFNFTSPCTVVTSFFSRSSQLTSLNKISFHFIFLVGPCNQWRCKASSAFYVKKII